MRGVHALSHGRPRVVCPMRPGPDWKSLKTLFPAETCGAVPRDGHDSGTVGHLISLAPSRVTAPVDPRHVSAHTGGRGSGLQGETGALGHRGGPPPARARSADTEGRPAPPAMPGPFPPPGATVEDQLRYLSRHGTPGLVRTITSLRRMWAERGSGYGRPPRIPPGFEPGVRVGDPRNTVGPGEDMGEVSGSSEP